MKVGYPDTINSSAAAASPVKARYASSGEGKGDIEVVKVDIPKKKDSNKPKDSAKESDSPIEYGSTPINMRTPAKFASAAQRKAVWASKNEKKKKKK
jgi:hypothetical protein